MKEQGGPVRPADAEMATGQVIIVNTQTPIRPANYDRLSLTLRNLGGRDVYYGQSGVTTQTGALLLGSKGAEVSITARSAVYGIVASGNQRISWVEESVV